VTYSFRNRFKLQEGDELDAAVQEIKLADSAEDGLVVLRVPEREMGLGVRAAPISQAGELVLQGSGHPDLNTAEAAGRKWRQILTVALAREGKGVFFGPDDRIIPVADITYGYEPPGFLQTMGVEVGDRVIVDEYQLLVFPSEPTPKFVNAILGTPTVKISGWLGQFEKKINDAREGNRQSWNRQKALSYRLVHLALVDSNAETQHIQLVTALELLLKEHDRPQPILDALDDFIGEIDKWSDSDLKRRMTDILKDGKAESITRAGSEQVAMLLDGEYFERDAGRFFKYVYNMRSGLVHRERAGRPRPEIEDIREVQPELRRFVLDLLDAYEIGSAEP
jgi:hypothetical protein